MKHHVIYKILTSLAAFLIVAGLPIIVLAQSGGLVPCDTTCGFDDIFVLINNLIVFLIKTLFIPIVVLLFMYAGFKYITAGGDSKKIISIKNMLKHIVLGMLLVLCSWLIVKTIMTILVKDTSGALQFLE